jgi:hypothetical protein
MPYSYPISVVVGPAGATIEGTDGFKLVIPPNALSRLVTIHIAAPVTAPDVAGLTEVSRSYGITPDGLVLARPATVFVPYFPAYEAQRASIVVRLAASPLEPSPTEWVPSPQVLTEAGKMGGATSTLHSAMAAIG